MKLLVSPFFLRPHLIFIFHMMMDSDRLYRYGAMRSISAVLTDLYTRWARRPFSASTLWEIEQTDTSLIKTQLRSHTPFAIALLRVMPWSIDFYERLKLFREVVDGERVSIQGVLHDSNDPTRSKGGPPLSHPCHIYPSHSQTYFISLSLSTLLYISPLCYLLSLSSFTLVIIYIPFILL